ncbi:hypothetical protein Hypma_001384 [Hypsizygus marmoreus]|uniref:Uncharacterized protein n=1 Tax=Hypsizygus marmoreus TaxID=39966 RepID=A0A369KBI1_HYPMA|nr:hypothetical protein Hypma_001384 [Hypsizygus marmoreus]
MTNPRFKSMSPKADYVKGFPFIALWRQDLYRVFHMHLSRRPLIPLHPDIVRIDDNTFPPLASVRTVPDTACHVITSAKADTRCGGGWSIFSKSTVFLISFLVVSNWKSSNVGGDMLQDWWDSSKDRKGRRFKMPDGTE